MFLIISAGMIVTGVLFLVKSARMEIGDLFSDDSNSASRRISELKLQQKKSLRKMGILSIILGMALIFVDFIYLK